MAKTLSGPPKRGGAETKTQLKAARSSDDEVAITHRVPVWMKKELAKLSIETDREQRELVKEALTLLFDKHGGGA